MGGSSWCFSSGMPSSMVERGRSMLSSDDGTCSQLTVCVECEDISVAGHLCICQL